MVKMESVRKALGQMGFESVDQICIGTWSNYAMEIRQVAYHYAVLVAANPGKNGASLSTLRKSVKEKCPKVLQGIRIIKDALYFEFSLNGKTDCVEQLAKFLDAVVGSLKENGVAPMQTCGICGGDHPDAYCSVHSYRPVHASCVRSMKEDVSAAAEQNAEQGSYATGIIGAILGMLVGLIPNVLSIVFLERIAAILFALVPLAAMFGYRKFRGKKSVGAIVIVLILSLIGVFVLEIIVNSIYIMQEYSVGFGEAASFLLGFFFTGEGISAFIQDGLQMFLFMALGIFISWRYIFQTNQTQIASAAKVADTLRPMDMTYGADEPKAETEAPLDSLE